MSENELHVHIGEVKTGKEGDVLHALVGSCIAIGFLHKKRNICGLAHCLLSKSTSDKFEIGGRYVDQAIYSLLTLMEIPPEDVRNIRAIVAGGGNMTMPSNASRKKLVGSTNADFARKTLRERRIRITHEDLGGLNARKVIIDCSSNDFTVKDIPRLGAA